MSAVIVLVALPLLWSLLVHLARLAALQGRPTLSDGAEKLILALLLLPIVVGAVVLLMAPFIVPLVKTPLLAATFAAAVGPVTAPTGHQATQAPNLLPFVVPALLAAYALITSVLLLRTAVVWAKLARIAAKATPHDGIFRTAAAVPAFAWGNHRVILPATLTTTLSADDTALIVAHERAHLRRGDPLWFLALSLIEAVLWFNPMIRQQGRACRLAAELACDAHVLTATPHRRHAYARALIAALKHTVGTAPSCVAAASSPDRKTYALRLDHIMTQTPRPPKAAAWIIAIVALAVPVTGAQLAFAQTQPPASAPANEPTLAPAVQPIIVRPVDAPISSAFGFRPNPQPGERKNHIGIDFAAPLGTPVKAHASGKISFAGHRDGYGETVEIDNGGDTTTRYAHLGSINVKTGDTVSAGQVIADIGQPLSGAPHLHFELWHNHKVVDPTPLFPAGKLSGTTGSN